MAGEKAPVVFLQKLIVNMCINLCRRQVRMAQQLLHGTQVSPALQKMGCKGMAQGMNLGRNPAFCFQSLKFFPHAHA